MCSSTFFVPAETSCQGAHTSRWHLTNSLCKHAFLDILGKLHHRITYMTFEIFVLISEETRNKQKRCVSNFSRSIDQEDLYSGNCFALH